MIYEPTKEDIEELNDYLEQGMNMPLDQYEMVILPDGTEGQIAHDYGNGVFLIETENAFIRFDTKEYPLVTYSFTKH